MDNNTAVEIIKNNIIAKLKECTYWTDNLSDEYGGVYDNNYEVLKLQDAINIVRDTGFMLTPTSR